MKTGPKPEQEEREAAKQAKRAAREAREQMDKAELEEEIRRLIESRRRTDIRY
jgi:hypothetical protein